MRNPKCSIFVLFKKCVFQYSCYHVALEYNLIIAFIMSLLPPCLKRLNALNFICTVSV